MNYNEIAEAAYYKWEQSGKPEGRHDEFWFAAEHDLVAKKRANLLRSICQIAKSKMKNIIDFTKIASMV